MIKILSLADKDEWHNYLSMIYAEDIYFSPEYLHVNEFIIDGKAECFIYKDSNCVILYPYLRRSINKSIFYDLSSGYGFGGYIGWPRNKGITEFRNAFHQYCIDHNIVSEFIRFHPFFYNHSLTNQENEVIENYQPIVYSDFRQNNFDMKKMINKEVWKKIKRAEKKSIEVSEDDQDITYQEFYRLYSETMKRLQARKFYFFNQDFFQAIRKEMASSSILFTARYQGAMVGGLWILFGKTFSYNFLSCSDANYAHLGINDLLQWKGLEWAYLSGKQKHLLGGGRKGEDSLFRFKAKFSPDRQNYYLGKIIHLSGTYAKLCERMNDFDSVEREQLGPMGWFPYYRGLDADNLV
jgi:serine/alanine adding enzyme